MGNGKWEQVKTLQYARLNEDGTYDFIEADVTLEGEYVILRPMNISLKGYIIDGKYSDSLIKIINRYYYSVEDFENVFFGTWDDKKLLIASLIYRYNTSIDSDLGALTAREVSDYIKKYTKAA